MSFSIKQLLLSVVFVAVGLMALMNAGRPYVDAGVQLFNFIILAAFAYGAWLTSGERRAFRIGYVAWVAVWTLAYSSHFQLSQSLSNQVAPLFMPANLNQSPIPSPGATFGMQSAAPPTVIVVPADSSGDAVAPNPIAQPTPPSSESSESGQAGASSGFDDLFPSSTGQQAPMQTGQSGMNYYEWQNNFQSIFNELFTMLLGFVGGWVTVLVYRQRQRMLQSSAQPPGT